MARVTVEDCIDKVENRFELVMLASQRARKIGTGAALTVEKNDDKNNQNKNDWDSYEQKLKKEMAKTISTYPRPPVPANLTPYDDIDENNLRKPTSEESSKGTDDFPPVPPAMYLLK